MVMPVGYASGTIPYWSSMIGATFKSPCQDALQGCFTEKRGQSMKLDFRRPVATFVNSPLT
jgi:hypothetical protein